MTFFNLVMMWSHYIWLSVTSNILGSDLTDKVEPWQFFIGGIFVIYGMIFTLKEFISNVVSWVTGTTNYERKSGMAAPYFKSRGGTYSPFFKSVWIHVQEVVIAFLSSGSSNRIMTSATISNNLEEEEDEEKQHSQPISDLDMIMAKYLNPYATKLPCDWAQMDLLTIFEVHCEMRAVMRIGMKKMLSKMRGGQRKAESDEGSDEDVFVMDTRPPASSFPPGPGGHTHGHGGCGSCKSHSKKPVHSHPEPTQPSVNLAETKNQESTHTSRHEDL